MTEHTKCPEATDNGNDDPIGRWYARRQREKHEAFDRWQAAKSSGASNEEIRKLEKAFERAAYVGD